MSERMQRIALTGGFGFLGWHTACRLRALHGIEPVRLGRSDLADVDVLAERLANVDGVIHLAGVNRAESDAAVEQGNIAIAQTLASALHRVGGRLPVAYANSIQADTVTPYGRGKAVSADIVGSAATASFADIMLPNLFGEHGRPDYNSFVATFAHAVATEGEPRITGDREVPLMHAQDAAALLIDSLLVGKMGQRRPNVESHGVAKVLDLLKTMHAHYVTGDVPPLLSKFEVDLFNTYRSYRFPAMFPLSPTVHEDERGALFETVRSHGGPGQAFVSTTRPGRLRGDHYHLHKIERFFVVKGEAEIKLRRLFRDDVVTFRLNGTRPSFVDMPTLWVHNIRNVGDSELLTMFWSDQLLDPKQPDQYPERVEEPEVART